MTADVPYSSLEELEKLEKTARAELQECTSAAAAEEFRIRYLGKKGIIRNILKNIRNLDLKERKTVEAPLKEHAVNDEVGAGADQRAGSPKYGGVREGDQKFGGRKSASVAPVPHNGNECRNNGRIV